VAVIDVSLPIAAGMAVYEGDPPVEVTVHAARARGDSYDVSRLTLGSHTGTHVDAPAHFLDGGATVDRLPWDRLIGPARVAAVPAATRVTREELERLSLPPTERLLLRTRNSALWALGRFTRDYVALDEAAAGFIVDRGIRLVGIDYLSVEPWHSPGYPVHRRLLEAGVVILEGLDLGRAAPGTYELVCLPLPVVGLDGAPCRAVLRSA